jgi:hypothetical protein
LSEIKQFTDDLAGLGTCGHARVLTLYGASTSGRICDVSARPRAIWPTPTF